MQSGCNPLKLPSILKCQKKSGQVISISRSMGGQTDFVIQVSAYDKGYGKVAAFENCDPNFLICRKFSWLHSRLLLSFQDDLQKLERDLEREEEIERKYGNPIKLQSRSKYNKGSNQKRQKILTGIHQKLKDYGMCLVVRHVSISDSV